MKWCLFPLLPLLAWSGQAAGAPDPAGSRPSAVIVVGAPGEAGYGRMFSDWAAQWRAVCQKAGWQPVIIGLETNRPPEDRENLRRQLELEAGIGTGAFWLVLMGHGTFDGKTAKFNLRGTDLSDVELAAWLQPIQRPMALLINASCSGPFLPTLSRSNRVVVVSTRSGNEHNFSRFGGYMAAAWTDRESDLDQDGQVSLLEAFLRASRQVSNFYQSDGRLDTEHPLLEDNGDGVGTPSDGFRGVRMVRKSQDGALPDGLRAHQFFLLNNSSEQQWSPARRAQRDLIELELEKLRSAKTRMPVETYYQKLEDLLLELARLYQPE